MDKSPFHNKHGNVAGCPESSNYQIRIERIFSTLDPPGCNLLQFHLHTSYGVVVSEQLAKKWNAYRYRIVMFSRSISLESYIFHRNQQGQRWSYPTQYIIGNVYEIREGHTRWRRIHVLNSHHHGLLSRHSDPFFVITSRIHLYQLPLTHLISC